MKRAVGNMQINVNKFFEVMRNKGLFYIIVRVLRIDYALNAIFGPQQTLRLYLAAFKFRCNHNLFLKRRNLWLGQITLRNISKVSYVSPSKIEYVLDQKGASFYIEDGDWDLRKRKLQLHPTIKELFIDGVPYQETQQYKSMREAIKNKDYGKSYWCRTQEELDNYFKVLISTYHSIKKDGYKTQEELKKEDKLGDYDVMDEIRVSIDREGNYILENAGSHRLGIAKLLRLVSVPVIIVRIHYEWARSTGIIQNFMQERAHAADMQRRR